MGHWRHVTLPDTCYSDTIMKDTLTCKCHAKTAHSTQLTGGKRFDSLDDSACSHPFCTLHLQITLQRGSAMQCCIGDGSFKGEPQFSPVCRLKTPQPIQTKLGTIDNHAKMTDCDKIHRNCLRGFFSPICRSCTFWRLLGFFFHFSNECTARTGWPISTVHGSNDAVCSKDVPFGGLINILLPIGE